MSSRSLARPASVALTAALLAPPGPAAADVLCDGRAPTIVAVPWVATTGTGGDDVILGTDGSDVIDAGAGDDVVCGLAGGDEIIGGPGDDRLFGGLDAEYVPDDGYDGDLLVPGPGDDHVDLGDDPASADVDRIDWPARFDRVSYAGATGPVVVDLTAGTASGEGTDTIVVPAHSGGIVGSAYDDVLRGSPGHDVVLAGGGDDVVRTGPGRDTVAVVVGRDRISGGPGPDWIDGSGAAAGARLDGGEGRDVLVGGDRVALRGGPGRDALATTVVPGQRQLLAGGRGVDTVEVVAVDAGHTAPGRWTVDVPGQVLTGLGGVRMGYRGLESLYFRARWGRLTYWGSAQRDVLRVNRVVAVKAYGRRGRDDLLGSNRRDLLHGGKGRDVLTGLGGRDRCVAGERVSGCEVRR